MTEILYQEPLAHYKKRKNLRFLMQLTGLLMTITILLLYTIALPGLVSMFFELSIIGIFIIGIITALFGCIFIVKYEKRVTFTSEGFVASLMGPWDPEQLLYSEIAYIAWPPFLPNVLHIHMRTRWPRNIEMPVADLNRVVWILWSKGIQFRWAAWYER